MDVKTLFFDVMSEVQKDLEDVSAGIHVGQFKQNPRYKNFIRNLTSKLARSTLTLPGRIRVKSNMLNPCFILFNFTIVLNCSIINSKKTPNLICRAHFTVATWPVPWGASDREPFFYSTYSFYHDDLPPSFLRA
jgi:hypothetical protein